MPLIDVDHTLLYKLVQTSLKFFEINISKKNSFLRFHILEYYKKNQE